MLSRISPGPNRTRRVTHLLVIHVIGICMVLIPLPTPLQSAENDRSGNAVNADDVEQEVTAPKRSKRSRRQRNRKRAHGREAFAAEQSHRLSHNRSTETGSPRQLHLDGSFELSLGGNSSLRGEGKITIDVDQHDVQRLNDTLVENMRWITPLAHETIDAVATLPQTIESTREILTLLSDPETQKNLRHAEQVLGLLRPLSTSINSDATPTGEPAQ